MVTNKLLSKGDKLSLSTKHLFLDQLLKKLIERFQQLPVENKNPSNEADHT